MIENSSDLLRIISVSIVPLLAAITLHEWAHAKVACLRGDLSAKLLGRLTINPIPHIDPIGTIIIPMSLILFNTGIILGWAKPVPINENELKNPRWDMALVAIAGPIANLLMAIFWGLIIIFVTTRHQSSEVYNWLLSAAYIGVFLNKFLAAFNLIPILPLDGGRVLSALLPRKVVNYYDSTENYGFFIIIGLFALGLLKDLIAPIYLLIDKIINHLLF